MPRIAGSFSRPPWASRETEANSRDAAPASCALSRRRINAKAAINSTVRPATATTTVVEGLRTVLSRLTEIDVSSRFDPGLPSGLALFSSSGALVADLGAASTLGAGVLGTTVMGGACRDASSGEGSTRFMIRGLAGLPGVAAVAGGAKGGVVG